jgi:hypothetical protein
MVDTFFGESPARRNRWRRSRSAERSTGAREPSMPVTE